MTINEKTDIESKINNAIKWHQRKSPTSKIKKIVIILLVFAIFAVVSLFIKQFGYFGSIFGILIVFGSLFLLKGYKPRNNLNSAIKALEEDDFIKVVHFLVKSYKKTKNPLIPKIISTIADYLEQPELFEVFEIDNEQNPKKKKHKTKEKLWKIIDNLQKILNFILKCRAKINDFQEKTTQLKNDLISEKNKQIKEKYQNLISRYNEMISLENKKLHFYTQSKQELYNLKEYHESYMKLKQATSELEAKEDDYFKKSFIEKYIPADNLSEFIKYENSYIEALEYYSEDISNSSTYKIFDQLKQEFADLSKL